MSLNCEIARLHKQIEINGDMEQTRYARYANDTLGQSNGGASLSGAQSEESVPKGGDECEGQSSISI